MYMFKRLSRRYPHFETLIVVVVTHKASEIYNSIYCTSDELVIRLYLLCDLIKKKKTQELIKRPFADFFFCSEPMYNIIYRPATMCLENGD